MLLQVLLKPLYLFLLWHGAGEGVRFSLNGTTYQNNSLVTLEDIGEWDDALLCLTDNTMCCARAQVPGHGILGDWYYPNGTGVSNSGEIWEFYRNRGQSVVRLNRRRGGVTGIYHCEIPDANGVTQDIYVGLYTNDNGEYRLIATQCECVSIYDIIGGFYLICHLRRCISGVGAHSLRCRSLYTSGWVYKFVHFWPEVCKFAQPCQFSV